MIQVGLQTLLSPIEGSDVEGGQWMRGAGRRGGSRERGRWLRTRVEEEGRVPERNSLGVCNEGFSGKSVKRAGNVFGSVGAQLGAIGRLGASAADM